MLDYIMDPIQPENHQHYKIVAKAIDYIAKHRDQQPKLTCLCKHLGLSSFYLQRIFSEWVGVSPKQFLQYLTKEYACTQLKNHTVMQAAYASGLSGPSRLHDLMIKHVAMTPGEYKQLGNTLTIYYGIHPSPFGMCLLAITHRGICKMAFFDTEVEQKTIEAELRIEWENAKIINDESSTISIFNTIFPTTSYSKKSLKLLLKGSRFQLQVWEALLSIPTGKLTGYQTIAKFIGKPTATRAVASPIAKNQIAYLIPCHRIIRQSGDFGQYRWHNIRKKTLIAWEASQQ